MANPEPHVALAACRLVLDRTYGKPTTMVVEADGPGDETFARLPREQRVALLEDARTKVDHLLRIETDSAVEEWERTGLHMPPLLARNGRA